MPVLESTARRLDELLAKVQAAARAPSLVAGLVRDGELCWSGVRGEVARWDGPAASVSTQYRIGSITKTMTTVLVLQLRDEGALSLDDRLGDHLDGVPFGDRSVRELLSHSGGLPAEPAGPWWERSPGMSFDDLAASAAGQDGVLPRQQQYHYSNLAFGLLGQLVGRLRGTTWRDALADRLLGPLEMAQTTYDPMPSAAQGYSVGAWTGTLTAEPHQDTGAMAAAGQLWSTAADLGRFATFLAEPDASVLAEASVVEMAVPRSGTPDAGATVTYGLGTRLLLTGEGRGLVGHTGSMPGFLAGLFVDRDRRVGALCLANATYGVPVTELPRQLLAVLGQEEPTLPAPWRPSREVPAEIVDIVGVWYWGELALELRYDAGELHLRPPATEPAMRYRPAGADSYLGVSGYHTGETLRVIRGADGRVRYLECATFVYTRSPYDTDVPIPGGHPPR